MFQPIKEPIKVLGIYENSKFTPKKFKWHTREYVIEEITLTADIRDGGIRTRQYSVLSGGNLYRLKFNRDYEHWTLEEICCEG